ncbi:pirin family protein [Chryseobacterium wanjuense]
MNFPAFIGLYDGRKKQKYDLKLDNKSIFGIVINGACEFQDRLLETRDAILLQGLETLEFDALSENLLVIFLEI